MKEFALVFSPKDISGFKPSPEQMQERMNWLAGITTQNKPAAKGNPIFDQTGGSIEVREVLKRD